MTNQERIQEIIREYLSGMTTLGFIQAADGKSKEIVAGERVILDALEYRLSDCIYKLTSVDERCRERHESIEDIINLVEFLYNENIITLIRIIRKAGKTPPNKAISLIYIPDNRLIEGIYNSISIASQANLFNALNTLKLAKNEYLLADSKSASQQDYVAETEIDLLMIIKKAINKVHGILCN